MGWFAAGFAGCFVIAAVAAYQIDVRVREWWIRRRR